MTQERKRRASPDEGAAAQTAQIMEAVKARRTELKWSAEQLAAEMAAVGVPWTRDSVTNLETGRRKQVAVHEAIALAYVLEVGTPLEVIVPRLAKVRIFPVTPTTMLEADAVRAWFLGQTGPLRQFVEPSEPDEHLAELRRHLREDQQLDEATIDDVLKLVISAVGPRREVTYPESVGYAPAPPTADEAEGGDDGEG